MFVESRKKLVDEALWRRYVRAFNSRHSTSSFWCAEQVCSQRPQLNRQQQPQRQHGAHINSCSIIRLASCSCPRCTYIRSKASRLMLYLSIVLVTEPVVLVSPTPPASIASHVVVSAIVQPSLVDLCAQTSASARADPVPPLKKPAKPADGFEQPLAHSDDHSEESGKVGQVLFAAA